MLPQSLWKICRKYVFSQGHTEMPAIPIGSKTSCVRGAAAAQPYILLPFLFWFIEEKALLRGRKGFHQSVVQRQRTLMRVPNIETCKGCCPFILHHHLFPLVPDNRPNFSP